MVDALLLTCFLLITVTLIAGGLALLWRKASDPVYPIANSRRRTAAEKSQDRLSGS